MDEIGIVGYGVSLPTRKLDTETLIRLREGKRADLNDFLEKVQKSLGLNTKSVAGPGEDTITFATEAAENAIRMSKIDLNEINSVLVGSESKPYAVGQIARHVASFVGIKEKAMTLDTEAACNPTMENLYLTYGMVKAKEFDFGLVVGADVSQAPKGDPLEYAAGAGAGAFVVGREDLIASLIDFSYYSSLTQDFWRREGQPVPRHHGKTTVRAYMTHVVGAIEQLLEKHPELTLDHFDFITFHQPSAYMPMKTVKAFSGMVDNIKPEELIKNPENIERMRLTDEQIDEKIRPTLVVPEIGNLYAGSTIVATSNVLDKSKPGQEILAVSYGSGAHTTATWLRVESGIEKKRGSVPSFQDYLNRRVPITVPEYLKLQTRKTLGIDYPIYVGTVDPVQGSTRSPRKFLRHLPNNFLSSTREVLNN